jgi:Ca-activated chloride channel homolog
MKFKAVRSSLAAVLTATLLISLLPLAYASSATNQPQQGASPSKPRRGKNGDPATRGTANPDTLQGQDSTQDASKPETSTGAAPAKPTQQQPADSSDPRLQSGGQPVKTVAQQDPAPREPSASQESVQPQPQAEAPPFDRPPLRANGRRSVDSGARADSSPPSSRQRPSYSGPQPSSRGNQAPTQAQTSTSDGVQRDRFPESSSGGNTDPNRAERSAGPPPVLRRPAESRSQEDGSSQGPRAPVLRRPGDDHPYDRNSSGGAVGSPSASGQPRGGQPEPSGEDDVVKLESTLVNLPLLVSDRAGRYIPQLSARDFLLYEDGVQQTIASFGTEEVPFSVALVLDVSPSVQGNIDSIQDAAIAFVRQLRSQDQVMVVSFDRQIHYLSDFTSDRSQLEWAIRRAHTGSGTSVYDAVYEVVQRKLRNIDGRKALILFSDGDDTTSGRASYNDAVNAVTEADVLVYGLRYPGSGGRGVRVDPWPRSPVPGIQLPFPFPFPFPRRRRGPFRLMNGDPTGNNAVPSATPQSWPRRNGGGDFMTDITTAGGGPVYDAERISDMSRLASRIAEELRHVYVISYYPTNPLSNGGYRTVRVSVKGRDDIALRHRRGYNARPNGAARPTI